MYLFIYFLALNACLGCSLLYLMWATESRPACVLASLRLWALLSVSLRSLNCFLEAGDFVQGDKGNGMKLSHWLSISVFLYKAERFYWRDRGESGLFWLIPWASEAEETWQHVLHTVESHHVYYWHQNLCLVCVRAYRWLESIRQRCRILLLFKRVHVLLFFFSSCQSLRSQRINSWHSYVSPQHFAVSPQDRAAWIIDACKDVQRMTLLEYVTYPSLLSKDLEAVRRV